MTVRTFNIYSYGALIIVAILLLLMVTKAVPTEWNFYLLGVSILLFIVRIVLRIYFSAQQKKSSEV